MPQSESENAKDSPEDNQNDAEETLAERSERLEREATALNQPDPLAPEPHPETPDASTDETASGMDPAEAVALQNELNDAKDKMMRALAEAENTRRRAQKEREDASKFAISSFSRDLLAVADNLRRALAAVPEDLVEADIRIKNLLDGIEATERELLRSFEKNGIEKTDPTGEVFDPNFHEVMFEAPGTGQPAGTITEVIETGYVLNGRLLRPARVGVAKDEGQGSGETPPSSPGGTIDTEA